MTQDIDVAAFVWPAYGFADARAKMFWPDGIGEWQTVQLSDPKYPGHSQPRQPIWGYLNEADPRVMEMQIDAAADHGVSVFIYDWYWYDGRPFLESCLNDGYLGARNNDRVSFYLMWANHNASTLWDRRISDRSNETVWSAVVDREGFETIARRLIANYFSHPSYYRIDGKPVFMFYDVDRLIEGLGSVESVRDALDWFRGAAVTAGLGGLHLQYALRGIPDAPITGILNATPTDPTIVDALGFDSLSNYQVIVFADLGAEAELEYPRVVDALDADWTRFADAYSASYLPHVSVGWDNSPRFQNRRPHVAIGNTPTEVLRALQASRDYLERNPELPRLITLNSWNEWTETSYLQPDDLYGYGYLEAVREVFGPRGSGDPAAES